MSSTSVILNTVSPSSDPYPPASEYFYPTPSNAPLTVPRPSFASPGTPSSVPNVGTPSLFHKAIGNRTTDATISVAKTLFMDDLVWPNKQRAYSELTKGSICFAGAEEGPDVGMHGGKISRVRGLDWINKELAQDEHLITPQQLVLSDINALTERQPNLYGLLMRIAFAIDAFQAHNWENNSLINNGNAMNIFFPRIEYDGTECLDLLELADQDIDKFITLIQEANEHASNKHATDPNGTSHKAELTKDDLKTLAETLKDKSKDELRTIWISEDFASSIRGLDAALFEKLKKIRFDSLGLQEHTSRILQRDLATRDPSAPDSIQLYGEEVVSKIGHFLDSWNVCGVVIDGEANLAVDEDRLEGSRCQINVAVEGLAQVRSRTSYFVSATPERVVQEERVEGIQKLAQDFGEKLVAGDEIFVALHLLPVRKNNQLRFKYMYQCWSSRQLIDAAYQTVAAFKNSDADGTPSGVLNDTIRDSLQHADLPSEPPQATKSKEPERMLISTIVGAWRIGSVIDTKAAVQKRDGGQADPFKRHAIQVAVDTKWMGLYELQTKYGWKSMLPGDGVDFDRYFSDPWGLLFLKRFFASYSVGSFFSSLMMNCREGYAFDAACFQSNDTQVTSLMNDVKTICGTSLSLVTLDTDRSREHLKELEEIEKQLRKKYGGSSADYTSGVTTPFDKAIAELRAALHKCENSKAVMHSESVAFKQQRSSLLMFGCESESSTIDLIQRLSIVYRDDEPGTMLRTGRLDLRKCFGRFNINKQRAVREFVAVQSKIRESLKILEDYSSKKGAATIPTTFSPETIEKLIREYNSQLQKLLGTSSSGGASGSSGDGPACAPYGTSSTSESAESPFQSVQSKYFFDVINNHEPAYVFQRSVQVLTSAVANKSVNQNELDLMVKPLEPLQNLTDVSLLTTLDCKIPLPVNAEVSITASTTPDELRQIVISGLEHIETEAPSCIQDTEPPIQYVDEEALTLAAYVTSASNQIDLFAKSLRFDVDNVELISAYYNIVFLAMVYTLYVSSLQISSLVTTLPRPVDDLGKYILNLKSIVEEKLQESYDDNFVRTSTILYNFKNYLYALTPDASTPGTEAFEVAKARVQESIQVLFTGEGNAASLFKTLFDDSTALVRLSENTTVSLDSDWKLYDVEKELKLFVMRDLASRNDVLYLTLDMQEFVSKHFRTLGVNDGGLLCLTSLMTVESMLSIFHFDTKFIQISSCKNVAIDDTIVDELKAEATKASESIMEMSIPYEQMQDARIGRVQTETPEQKAVALDALFEMLRDPGPLPDDDTKLTRTYSQFIKLFVSQICCRLVRTLRSKEEAFISDVGQSLQEPVGEAVIRLFIISADVRSEALRRFSEFLTAAKDGDNDVRFDSVANTIARLISKQEEVTNLQLDVSNLETDLQPAYGPILQFGRYVKDLYDKTAVLKSTLLASGNNANSCAVDATSCAVDARPPTSSSKTASLYDMMRSSQERSKVAASPSAAGAASSQGPPSKRKEPLPAPEEQNLMPAPPVPMQADVASQKERGKKRAMTPAREKASLASAFGPSVPKNKASPTPSIRKANLPETSQTSPMDVSGSGAPKDAAHSSRSSSSGSAVSSSSSAASLVEVPPPSSVLQPSDPTRPVAPTMANPSQPSLPVTASGGRAAYRPRKMADTRQKKSGQ